MLVQIKLKDPNSVYSDNGKDISGADPIITELTPFICGLIYRNEAKIYESSTDKMYNSNEQDLATLSYFDLKKMALDLGIHISENPNKKKLIEMIKEKKNDVL